MYYLVLTKDEMVTIACHYDKYVVEMYRDMHRLHNISGIVYVNENKRMKGWIEDLNSSDLTVDDLFLSSAKGNLSCVTHLEQRMLAIVENTSSPLDLSELEYNIEQLILMKQTNHPHYALLKPKGKRAFKKQIRAMQQMANETYELYDRHVIYNLIECLPHHGRLYLTRMNNFVCEFGIPVAEYSTENN